MSSPIQGLPNLSLRFSATRADRDAAAKNLSKLMPDARLMGRTHLAGAGEMQQSAHLYQYIVWDAPSSEFYFRSDSYKPLGGLHKEASVDRPIAHGMHLSDDFVGGAVVDQKNKRIYLPSGGWIDGPTGETYTVHGKSLFEAVGNTKEC